jgi:UDP-N-acetylglucosamine 2-epimerase (non-hydrolysing)
VLNSIQLVIKEFEKTGGYRDIPEDYRITNTSWRVLKLIAGNAKLSNLWDGIRKSK